MNNRGLAILAGVLGILLIGAIIWGFSRRSEAETLRAENTEVNEGLEAMTALRDQLASQVDSLSQAYQGLAVTNEELSGNLANTQGELEKAQQALSSAKRSGASQVNDLKAQIQQLMEARAGLEQSIAAVQMENDSLRNRLGVVETDLARSVEENQALANLNQAMQGEVDRLTLENFKASGFAVEMQQRRGEKQTAKSRRARRIVVNFDLPNVPEKYQGVRPIYLVISDEKGTPIQTANPIQARATVNGQPMDLIAVEAKEVNIGDSQRLSFTHELEDRLAAGYYRASVFTDIGLLGASNFRLQ